LLHDYRTHEGVAMMRRPAAVVASVVIALAGLTGCGDPDQKMLSEGARAARDAASDVGTARMAAESLLDHKLWPQPANVLVSDAEQAVGKVATTFDERQPTTERSRATYDEFSAALSDAETSVTDLRIALQNDDLAAVAQQITELRKAGQRLDQLGERAR
jgi:hypothetical protein